VLFGIGWGSAFPTLLNFASDLSFENTTGQTMSIISASFSIGTALGGLIVGLLTQYFTFQVSFLFLAFSLIGAMLILSFDYKKRISSH
jgi:MFS family permease